jgi:hypothetical protein
MQEKRNIRLLISFVLLLITTGVVYFFTQSTGEVVTDKTIFKVDDFATIDRVVLTGAGDSKVDLSFDGARWKVNQEAVDPNMVDVLFATMQQAEPKRPVAAAVRDSVNAWLAKYGVKVSLYEAGEIKREFVAGGNPAKTQSYFKDLDSDEIYLVVIPGYRVYTSGIFELDMLGWKDKYVFGFNWRNFKKLTATLPAKPTENFEIEMGKEYFEVKGIEADTAKLNSFLDAVSLTTVVRYLSKNELNGIDSMLTKPGSIEIRVDDISGKTYSLSLYPELEPGLTIGLVNGNQPAVLDSRRMRELQLGRSGFLKK